MYVGALLLSQLFPSLTISFKNKTFSSLVSNYLQVCCQYCHKRVIQMKIKLSLRDVKTTTFTSFAHKLTMQILIFHWNHLHITYFNYLHRTDHQRTIRDNNIHWNQFYPTCHLPTMPASTKTLPLLASRIFPLMVARLEINASLLLCRPCCLTLRQTWERHLMCYYILILL